MIIIVYFWLILVYFNIFTQLCDKSCIMDDLIIITMMKLKINNNVLIETVIGYFDCIWNEKLNLF